MHDLGTFRANLDAVAARLATQGTTLPLDEFRALDQRRRAAITEAEQLRAEQNLISRDIPRLRKEGVDTTEVQQRSRSMGDRVAALNKVVDELDSEFRDMLAGVPNIPHESVPVGKSADDNVVVRCAGEPPVFDFPPQAHWDIGPRLGILDFDRAAKITGARFAVYFGLGAKLERALINFMLDTHTREHGYTEVLPPFMVNSASLFGTGQLPKFADDLFKLEKTDYWLIPTAEVPVTNLYRDETLEIDALPISFCAYTPCFRSEAGSYGRDVRGIIRQHQFQKVELVKFTRPDQSFDELDRLTDDAEDILRRTGPSVPHGRSLHRGHGLRLRQDVRYRGLVARTERLQGDLLLFELRSLSGTPRRNSLQIRQEIGIRPHAERQRSGRRPHLGRDRRKLSAARWQRRHPRGAERLPQRGANHALRPTEVRSALMKFLALCLACLPLFAADNGQTANWSPAAAASYLDSRAAWWAAWPNAARDHGTFCISCHTVAPYTLGRVALRSALGESEVPLAERVILENLGKRVRMWNELEPFYSDAKVGPGTTARARGTEAVLTAAALVWNSRGPSGLSSDAKLALDNMWAEQVKSGDAKGSWEWIEFRNAPWEGDSRFYGATLGAIAAGSAPADPRYSANLDALRAYLIRDYASQKPIDRIMMLWASTRVSGLLTPARRDALVKETIAKQSGRWRLQPRRVHRRLETARQHASRNQERRLCHGAHRLRTARIRRARRQGFRCTRAGLAAPESAILRWTLARLFAQQAA